MLFGSVEPKVLGVKVEHSKDEDDRRVTTELATLPQVRFLQARRYSREIICVYTLHQIVVKRKQVFIQFLLERHERSFHQQVLSALVGCETQLQSYCLTRKRKYIELKVTIRYL